MLLSVRLLSTVLLNVSENGVHSEYFPVNVGRLSFGSFNPEVDVCWLSSVTVCGCLGAASAACSIRSLAISSALIVVLILRSLSSILDFSASISSEIVSPSVNSLMMRSFNSSILDTCSLPLSREHLIFEISSSVSVLGSFSRIYFTEFSVLVIVPRWPDLVFFKASAISNLIILLFNRLNFQVSKFLGKRGTKMLLFEELFLWNDWIKFDNDKTVFIQREE